MKVEVEMDGKEMESRVSSRYLKARTGNGLDVRFESERMLSSECRGFVYLGWR